MLCYYCIDTLYRERNMLVNRLKERRTQARFKLKDVALALDVSVVTVANWEASRREISLSKLDKLIKFYASHGFNYTLDDVFEIER